MKSVHEFRDKLARAEYVANSMRTSKPPAHPTDQARADVAVGHYQKQLNNAEAAVSRRKEK